MRKTSIRSGSIVPLFGALVLCSCNGHSTPAAQQAAQPAAPAQPPPQTAKLDRVNRLDFNRIAQELFQPIFWVEDKDGNGAISPDELAVLWGMRETTREEWVAKDQFTPAFVDAYERITQAASGEPAPKAGDEAESKRRTAIAKELAQGRPTVVLSTLKDAPEEDKMIVKNIVQAAKLIERLFALQKGTHDMEDKIPADDTASRAVFHRNHGPWCAAPLTEKDPDCNALSTKPAKVSGLYPASIQKGDDKFCEKLAARKDGEQLLHQFFVVREGEGGKLDRVPYNEAYKTEMEQVSKLMKETAAAVTSPGEAPLRAYLEAVAQSYLDNNWNPADEAWSKMTAQNSKWYLRIQPDEVYYEPCSRKAGFHVSFARINQASLEWQQKLEPVKNDMEKAIAELAGKPYKARNVKFHLPDFIDIILNAGDSRPPHGATIGQSLPNWGPVKDQARGRTVAMTNFYTDADSKNALREQASSLFCAKTMESWTDDPAPLLMSTVLHEAAHNLGPEGDYKVKGKTDRQIFGGPLSSMLEELKAQSSALFFAEWLAAKGIVDRPLADKAHTRDIAWGFGHISRGMYEDGKPKPYSQLAAIQFGFLMKEGAIAWHADEAAANKTDKGCFELQHEKFPAAVKKLESAVAGIKARGDKKLAESLQKEHVGKDGETKPHLQVITERWLRAPKASFVYAIEL
jgi:hypothetical protein